MYDLKGKAINSLRDRVAATTTDGDLVTIRRDEAMAIIAELGRLGALVVSLQAFKDWVHAYLDQHGVPHHPPGPHGAEGCRIGDRMDWVMARTSGVDDEFAAALNILSANPDPAPAADDTGRAVTAELWQALQEYGRHSEGCSAAHGIQYRCRCGWREELPRLAALMGKPPTAAGDAKEGT